MPMIDRKKIGTFSILIYFLLAIWLVECVNYLSGHALCNWGLLPRTLRGIAGIPLSPFLHTGFLHLLLNTGPLVILGGMILLYGRPLFFKVNLYVIFLGGMGVWLFGRSSYHVGASILIFGYFGYLASRGIFNKKIGSLMVSLVTILLYGGLFWGMLPTLGAVSWEGHLFGFIAGILAAKIEKK